MSTAVVARHGESCRGFARSAPVRHGLAVKACHVGVRHGGTSHGSAGAVCPGVAGHVVAGPGRARQSGHGTSTLVPVGLGWVRCGVASPGWAVIAGPVKARHGLSRRGMAWRGSLGSAGRVSFRWGSAWHGLARQAALGGVWQFLVGRGMAWQVQP